MRLRLHGTPTEVALLVVRLCEVLDVVAESDPYPDRTPASGLVRVYLEVRMPYPPAPVP